MKNLLFTYLLTISTIGLSEDLPPLPPTMIETLSVPVGEIKLENIFFASGSSGLTKKDKDYLSQVFSKIKDQPLYVQISAYTDKTGDTNDNLILSQRRAESVKLAIQSATQWSSSHFIVSGYGESAASSDSGEQDRRVEIQLRAPKRFEDRVSQMRKEIRATGVDLDFTIGKAANSEANERQTQIQPEQSPWGMRLGLVLGSGKREGARFSRSGIAIAGLYQWPSENFVALEFQNSNITLQGEEKYFLKSTSFGATYYFSSRLHKIARQLHGFGATFETSSLKAKNSQILLPMNASNLSDSAAGLQYHGMIQFNSPRISADPAIGLLAYWAVDRFFLALTISASL